jgi:hypothetical protein
MAKGRKKDFIFRSNKHLRKSAVIIGAPRVGGDVHGFGFLLWPGERGPHFVGVLRQQTVHHDNGRASAAEE